MRTPIHSPREQEVLRAATTIVARALVGGEWREQEFPPDPALGERTPADALRRVQHALRHHRDLSQIVLYAQDARGHRACLDHHTVPALMEERS